jgi:hypothetical protein
MAAEDRNNCNRNGKGFGTATANPRKPTEPANRRSRYPTGFPKAF